MPRASQSRDCSKETPSFQWVIAVRSLLRGLCNAHCRKGGRQLWDPLFMGKSVVLLVKGPFVGPWVQKPHFSGKPHENRRFGHFTWKVTWLSAFLIAEASFWFLECGNLISLACPSWGTVPWREKREYKASRFDSEIKIRFSVNKISKVFRPFIYLFSLHLAFTYKSNLYWASFSRSSFAARGREKTPPCHNHWVLFASIVLFIFAGRIIFSKALFVEVFTFFLKPPDDSTLVVEEEEGEGIPEIELTCFWRPWMFLFISEIWRRWIQIWKIYSTCCLINSSKVTSSACAWERNWENKKNFQPFFSLWWGKLFFLQLVVQNPKLNEKH